MSFCKAKLQRFNEEITCAPPPGTYDPKLDTKIKGSIIQTSKRFPDQLCCSASLDSLEKPNSTQVTFRTPQVLKKVPLTPQLKSAHNHLLKYDTPGSSGSSISSSKSDDKLNFTTRVKNNFSRADYQRLENELSALADKHLSELMARNLEIAKLKQDLQEIQTHETELKLILEEKNALVIERHKEVLEMKTNLDKFVENLTKERQDHQKYIDELKEEILQLQAKKEDLEGIVAEKQSAIVAINDKYVDLENELKSLKQEKEIYEEDILRMQVTHLEILNTLTKESEKKLDELDQHIKLKVYGLEQEFDTAQQQLQIDFQTKVNFVSHEFDLETCEIKNKMEKYTGSIKELEKMVNQKIREFSKNIEEADDSCKYMYRELCKVERQRDDLLTSDLEKKLSMIEIQEKSDLFKENLEHCKDKCKKYEVTLNTMQNTIKALSYRLLESESEVERLSQIETDLETQKKVLEEKSQLLLADITSMRDGMESMEKDLICEVTALKDHLGAKVEHFKAEAAKQIDSLNETICEKQCAIDLLLNENDNLKKEHEKKEELVKQLQYKVSKSNKELSTVNDNCSKMEVEFTEKLNVQKNLSKILTEKLESAQDTIKELKMLKYKNEKYIKELVEKNSKSESSAANFETKCITLENKYSERCVSLEKEIDLIKDELCTCEQLSQDKSKKIQELSSKLECLQRSLQNAEEKIKLADSTIKLQVTATESQLNNIITDSKTKISCLEAEKSNLDLQLVEAIKNIFALEKKLDERSIIVNNLTNQISILNDKNKDYSTQIDNLCIAHNKLKEEMLMTADQSVKLSDAEERVFQLLNELSVKDTELALKKNSIENLEKENKDLIDNIEGLRLKLHIVTEEKKKQDQELAELMGHQNIHQKIKHVHQLKQHVSNLQQRVNNLEVENSRLKKKLAEFKENDNIPRLENSPKFAKPTTSRRALSPAVLKDRNH